jgi:hypothetical protein
MPFVFTNFIYDPSRDGYDADAWKTVFGSPQVLGGKLALQQASILHRGDCLRGDYVFNLNIPNTPIGGESRKFGLFSPNLNSYLWFSIRDNSLFAEASDGGLNTESEEITWQDGVWDSNNVEFKIIWEAGLAHFYVNNVHQKTLSGENIPRTPMALYVINENEDFVTLQYITVVSVQSFYMHTDHADADTGDGPIYTNEGLTLSENTTTVREDLAKSGEIETSTITELVTITRDSATVGGSVETTSIAENITAVRT